MKNKLMRAATILMVLTLMTSCFVGSTFAKYTSTTTATDSAKVAKWSILVEGTEIAVQPEATTTFNLFDTVYEVDATTADGDVAADRIAPGTGGQFDFSIENESEVNARYTVTLAATEANGDIPIEYSLDGTTWETAITDLNGDASLTNIAINMGAAASDTATVYWRWAFTGAESANYTSTQTDTTDTALGIAARGGSVPQLEIVATIAVEQVN